MNIYDLIFWYTGCGVWAVVAVAAAIGLLVCFVLAMVKAYRQQKQWMFYKLLCERKDIEIMSNVVLRVGGPNNMTNKQFLKWLNELHEEYKIQKVRRGGNERHN